MDNGSTLDILGAAKLRLQKEQEEAKIQQAKQIMEDILHLLEQKEDIDERIKGLQEELRNMYAPVITSAEVFG